jgi:hypothetical protein
MSATGWITLGVLVVVLVLVLLWIGHNISDHWARNPWARRAEEEHHHHQ